MKKLRVLKLAVLASFGYIVVCAYHAGAAASGGYDCTGAETGLGNPKGCTTGGGCHASAATTNIGVVVELDSTGGKATKYYIGGGKYTVKITGTNNGSTSQPAFGFQLGCIKGSAAVATPTNEGTFNTPYPTKTQYSAPSSGNYTVGVMEQTTQIPPTSGSGAKGTTYVESFAWTAPAKGTGTISFWGVLNAVNDNGTNDKNDLWNTAQLVVTEITAPTAVENVMASNAINVYPNPVTEHVTFSLANEANNATVSLYDMTGRMARQINFSGKEVTLEKGDLAKGVYIYTITNTDNSDIHTGKIVVE